MDRLARFWGLIAAYWLSERWVEAWGLTIAVLAVTTLLSKSSVWAATASGDFLAALAGYHDTDLLGDPAVILFAAALAFLAIHVARAGAASCRHLLATTLHRRARAWLVDRFDRAILADERIAMDLMSDRGQAGSGKRLPDAIDQRIDECSDGLYGGLIGLAMGFWSAVASIGFVSQALLERTAAVPALDHLAHDASAMLDRVVGHLAGPELAPNLDFAPGIYGSALLVGLLIVLYVPAITFVAWLIGRVLQRLTLWRQQCDGAWRGEMVALFNRVTQLATSRGELTQRRVNVRLYGDVDQAWKRQNYWAAGMMLFTDVYNFLSHRLLAYLPALPAYTSGAMSFRDFITCSELTASLIGDVSWFINVMPAIAHLRANAERLTQLAQAIERVRARSTFYGETGVSRFERRTGHADWRLRFRDLELRHRGHTSAPFLHVAEFGLKPGEWAYVRGRNGCGKSSLLKAAAGLWPYGQGQVVTGTSKPFFAGQEPDLPDRLSLHALVTYPSAPDAFARSAVVEVLSRSGLGQFVPQLDQEFHHGHNWRNVLSGGQRQRLVLARILLQQPELILLDEATAAMDTASAQAFYVAVREGVPGCSVLAVLHGEPAPADPSGQPFFDSVLDIAGGMAAVRPARRRLVPLPAE